MPSVAKKEIEESQFPPPPCILQQTGTENPPQWSPILLPPLPGIFSSHGDRSLKDISCGNSVQVAFSEPITGDLG